MTYKQVAAALDSVGLPVAYSHFPEPGQAPPFVIYYYPGINDVYADNKNYQRIVQLTVELYSLTKDLELEWQLEDALTAAGLSYDKVSNYIASERMFQTVYETEVMING